MTKLAQGVCDDRFSSPLRPRHLHGSAYHLEVLYGNTLISAGPDGALIVDVVETPQAEPIEQAVDSLAPGSQRYLVNTHAHLDHTAGNSLLGRKMPIIAHAKARPRMQSEQHIVTGIQKSQPALPAHALPVITFERSLSFHLNGEEIRMLHFPHGHTDNDIVVWLPASKVIHLGDMFWPDQLPFVDVDNGGSVKGLIRNIEDILGMIPPDTAVIPGHGPLSPVEALRRYHIMMVETVAFIEGQMENGRSKAQITANFPERWASWQSDFIPAATWIEIVMVSLEKEK